MGSVGKSITNTVSNITSTITKPVTTLFTNPTKLNIGDIAVLGSGGLAAPTVDVIHHPGDAPVIAGAVLGVAGGTSALAGAGAASSTEAVTSSFSAPDSASSYSSSFASGGGGPGYGLTGSSNPLDITYTGPAIPSAAIMGSVDSQGGLWGFLGRAGDSAKGLISPILSGAADITKSLSTQLGIKALWESLNKGNANQPIHGFGGDITIGTTNSPGLGGTQGQGTGYSPYGSDGVQAGTPASTNQIGLAGSLLSGIGPSTLIYFALVLIAGWYFFLRKRHA